MSFTVYKYKGWVMQFYPSGNYTVWREDYSYENLNFEDVKDHLLQALILITGKTPKVGRLVNHDLRPRR